MRNGISFAAAVSTAIWVAAVVFLRWTGERSAEATPVERDGIRVGIVLPGGERGLVVAPASEVLREATARLGLPEACAAAAAGEEIADGELLDFSTGDRPCETFRHAQLTGAARLTVGLPLDINAEDASGLAILPGIGPKKAAAVEAYRKANGPFHSIDDLIEVRAIGPMTVARLRSWITAGPGND